MSFFKGSRLANRCIISVLIGVVKQKCSYLGLLLVGSWCRQAG